jgi:hypothetical protein
MAIIDKVDLRLSSSWFGSVGNVTYSRVFVRSQALLILSWLGHKSALRGVEN